MADAQPDRPRARLTECVIVTGKAGRRMLR